MTVPGLDLEKLLPWFRVTVADVDELSAEVVGHGRSNLTYRISSGDQHWVLRRPPLAHVLPTAHDMRREFRVISAMAGTAVPAPDAIAYCDDPDVNERPFYVMEYVDGFIPVDPKLTASKYTELQRRHMSEHLIDVLAALHSLEPDDVGLGDFGKPQGFIARQVRRFTEQIETAVTRDVPELLELSRRLTNAIPQEAGAAIVHGDYRLDNCIMDDDGKVAAVLDWEMATLGDPLTDLGILKMYWGEGATAGTPSNTLQGQAVISLPGFLSWDEAIARYAAKSGRDIGQLDYYIVLAHFKLAVILEGIRERYQQGGTVGQGFEGMAARSDALARSGLAVADASAVTALHA